MSSGSEPSRTAALPRWCGRLAFTRDVWAGRTRVLADAELEATLQAAAPLPGPAAALIEELLPDRGQEAWLLAHELGGKRRGAYAFDEFEAVLAESPWEVAVVDLGRLFVDAASLSRFAARARGRIENRLETRAFRLLTAIGEGTLSGRVAIVSSPAAGRGGLSLTDFQDLVAQHFARARVYALATVPVAVVVDCGEVVREEEDAREEDDEGEPPLGFDNRLGDDLRYDTYVALVGVADAPLGVTLVELPAAPEVTGGKVEAATRAARDGEVEDLKIQLAQARRQVELAAIARQSLATQLDAAQSRVDALEDQVAELGRRQQAAPEGAQPAAPVVAQPEPLRPDAAQATIVALRWQLEQAQGELRAALGRPVEALEREVAELRARLARIPRETP